MLIDANIPEIAQARRLGHVLDDDIQDIYSHVSEEILRILLAAIQQRWEQALTHVTSQQLALTGIQPAAA